jgi:hypothetical protein
MTPAFFFAADYPTHLGILPNQPLPEFWRYCNFAYSALAWIRTGTSGSASFQSVRKSL